MLRQAGGQPQAVLDILELEFTTAELEWLCWVNDLPLHKLISKLMVDYRIKVIWMKDENYGR